MLEGVPLAEVFPGRGALTLCPIATPNDRHRVSVLAVFYAEYKAKGLSL
jgi:hypothetical protein